MKDVNICQPINFPSHLDQGFSSSDSWVCTDMTAYRISAGIPRCHIREAPGQQLIENYDLQESQGDARLHLYKAGSYQMTEV